MRREDGHALIYPYVNPVTDSIIQYVENIIITIYFKHLQITII